MLLTAGSRELFDKTAFAELGLYDLSGKVTYDSTHAKGQGAFSEVFRGVYNKDTDQIDVAVKRLRFYLDSVDCEKVCFLYPFGLGCGCTDETSYLNASYMSGQSSVTIMSFRSWALHSHPIPETR